MRRRRLRWLGWPWRRWRTCGCLTRGTPITYVFVFDCGGKDDNADSSPKQ